MSSPSDRVISVLVADDDADQRTLNETILLEAGWAEHDVTLVPDGREALRALRERVFDVAILDLSMPGLDGLEVFEAIGEDPHRPQVDHTLRWCCRDRSAGGAEELDRPGNRQGDPVTATHFVQGQELASVFTPPPHHRTRQLAPVP